MPGGRRLPRAERPQAAHRTQPRVEWAVVRSSRLRQRHLTVWMRFHIVNLQINQLSS